MLMTPNEYIRKLQGEVSMKEKYGRAVMTVSEQMQEEFSCKTVIQATWLQPTFLIGFPRSGTTLLDTILRTHSKIDVIEEKAILSKAQLHLGNKLSIVDIENLTSGELANAKEIYFEELEKFVSTKSGGCVIDKLPLNILDVPIIHKLFPTAKFILALRHPLDSILSCWMQLFRLNPAMANMVELDRIVDFYGEAMTVLELSDVGEYFGIFSNEG